VAAAASDCSIAVFSVAVDSSASWVNSFVIYACSTTFLVYLPSFFIDQTRGHGIVYHLAIEASPKFLNATAGNDDCYVLNGPFARLDKLKSYTSRDCPVKVDG
jgi:hypothetical protein